MKNHKPFDREWDPVTGCTKVSAGCKNCYAEKVADRVWGDRKFTDVRTHAERLEAPLRWRKPRRVFVSSMSDLFHEDVPDEFIDHVFAVMAQARKHTFQVLTKRPDRMRVFMLRWPVGSAVAALPRIPSYTEMTKDDLIDVRHTSWPLPNVWLGVRVRNQREADERIPLLLDTPAAVRFISAEPLLGPVDLSTPRYADPAGGLTGAITWWPGGVDWITVGGESGKGARPCAIAWIRDIVEQCAKSEVPCFVKQLGSQPIARTRDDMSEETFAALDRAENRWDEHRGPILLPRRSDTGRDPSEWPEDIRVREFPEEK